MNCRYKIILAQFIKFFIHRNIFKFNNYKSTILYPQNAGTILSVAHSFRADGTHRAMITQIKVEDKVRDKLKTVILPRLFD